MHFIAMPIEALVVLSSIIVAQEFNKFKLTRFKPLNCPECFSLWLYLILYFTHGNPLTVKPFLTALAIAATTRIINGIYIRYVGYLGK